MPIIGWIRDLLGIGKDAVETRKAQLEIRQLKDEQREKLITPATLDDVKKYDPKVKQLEQIISEEESRGIRASIRKITSTFLTLLRLLIYLIRWLLSR